MSKVKIDKEALKEALKPVYYSIKYVNSSKACLTREEAISEIYKPLYGMKRKKA